MCIVIVALYIFYVIWPQLVMLPYVNMTQDLRQIQIKLINKSLLAERVWELTIFWKWEGGNFTPCWFFLDNSETEKSCNCSILKHLVTFHQKHLCPNLPQSRGIGQYSDEGTSDFQISEKSLIKENCLNSRISYDIGMKLETVTKLDKRKKITLKKI